MKDRAFQQLLPKEHSMQNFEGTKPTQNKGRVVTKCDTLSLDPPR